MDASFGFFRPVILIARLNHLMRTYMPKVQEVVKQFFGKEPHKGVDRKSVV